VWERPENVGREVVLVAAKAAASHRDCLTSLQSCFSTREIYSCIVVCFFFFFLVVGRYKTAYRRKGKFKKKKLWAAGSQSKRQSL
jgi:hypothetical protein